MCIPLCTSNKNGLHEGIRYFQVTTRTSKYHDYDGWRNKIINIITKDRTVKITEFKARVMKGNVYVCDRHYADEDIEWTGIEFFNVIVTWYRLLRVF